METSLDRARRSSRNSTSMMRSSARGSVSGGGNNRSSTIFGGSSSSMYAAPKGAGYYEHFKGWSYVCINAIGRRAARQNPKIGVANNVPERGQQFRSFFNQKTYGSMTSWRPPISKFECRQITRQEHDAIFGRKQYTPSHLKTHSHSDITLIEQHPLLDALMHPNEAMTKSALIYVTIADMELTGRAYWWMFKQGDELNIWPIPSGWVRPVSTKEKINYAYKVKPPGSLGTEIEIPADQIAPFVLPDPANPLQSVSPLGSQGHAVKLDEQIQGAQQVSMEQGIYPGVILSAGRLSDQPNGIPGNRPVLSPEQRRDLITAIRGVYRGVRDMREPFIVDGLIESITPFTLKPAEMDFIQSGDNVKSRIFGAFGVNPIIIGEIAGANRAQAAVAENNFVGNVINPLLEMLGEVLTSFFVRSQVFPEFGSAGNLIMWIEPAESTDDDLQLARWNLASRPFDTFSSATRNEYRMNVLGLPSVPEYDTEDKLRKTAALAQLQNRNQNPQGTGGNDSNTTEA